MTSDNAYDLGAYDVGDGPTLWIEFRDTAGSLADPTDVVLTMRKPDGSTSTPPPTHPSLGRYEAAIEFDQHGRWDFHWQGSGGVVAAARAYATVERSRALGS